MVSLRAKKRFTRLYQALETGLSGVRFMHPSGFAGA